MPLRIADIIHMPELRTRFFAGDQGKEREIRWAHVCELPDPTEWLGDADLLMTTGIGIPVAPEMQTTYIRKLADAGLAGLMIGENMQAPKDLNALQQAADMLNFPVLMTQYGVPFSSVTKAVIDAGRKEEFEHRNAMNRLFISARMAIEGLSLEQLLQRLEIDLHAELMLMDMQDRRKLWYPKNSDIPINLETAIQGQPLDFSDTHPVVRRYILDDGDIFAVSVPSGRGSILLIRHAQRHFMEYSLLHHLVAVVGIAIERLHVETERSLRIGSQLLDDLLNLRISPYDAEKKIESFGLKIASTCLAVTRPGKHKLAEWNLQFFRMDTPLLLRPQGDELIILIDTAHIWVARKVLNTDIGFSNEVECCERLSEALREARLALVHVGEKSIVSYGDIVDKVPWLPDNLDDAARTFSRVLGPLANYEAKHGTPLLRSLKIFLENNRSWLMAAKQLHIHKTTLIYRMRKIESMTGRSLDSTEDVAILWLALRAGEIADLLSKK